MTTILMLLKEGFTGGVLSILRIALFLIPILVVIEMARSFNLLEAISSRIKGCLQFLTLPKEAAFPLVVGMVFGVVLGAALIIDYSREGYLKKRDLMLIGIFLCINHSVVEDTLVFGVFGANPVILLLSRIILAIIVTRLAAAVIDFFDRHRQGGLKMPGSGNCS